MKEWVNVEDKLPELNQRIMVRVKYVGDNPGTGVYSDVYKDPKDPFWTSYILGAKIIQWKPVPSKTCKECVYNKENCTCPNKCKKDEKGWLSEYKCIIQPYTFIFDVGNKQRDQILVGRVHGMLHEGWTSENIAKKIKQTIESVNKCIEICEVADRNRKDECR